MLKTTIKTIASILFITTIIIFTTSHTRANIIQWQSGNIQLMQGWNYAGPLDTRTLIAFEYANQWTYGDLYMFGDSIHFSDGSSTFYGEFSPRFSLSKITGKQLSMGIIKDFSISTNFEMGEGLSLRRLIGGAVDLDISGFTFFNINIYHRNNPRLAGDSYQVTVVWERPFQVANMNFIFEGFVDITGGEGTSNSNIHTSPRLLVDISQLAGLKGGKLFFGTEVDIWNNKFGQESVHETVPQLQLKMVF